MKRLALLVASLWLTLALAAAAVFGLGLDGWMDPGRWSDDAPLEAALIGQLLLIGDVLLVVPSSLVMVAHGAVFGLVPGAALSLLGSTGSALVAWLLGRFGGRLAERIAPTDGDGAHRLVERWGLVAVVLSRPIPILSETVAVVCGATGMAPAPLALGAFLGTLPPAVLYAWAGATAREGVASGLTLGLVLLMAGLAWLLGRASGKQAGT